MRQVLILLSLAVAFAGSFALASGALSATKHATISSSLPIGALPPTALDDATKVTLNNEIGSYQGARFGITSDSFSQVRQISASSGIPLYVVPGESGVCLVILYGSACGVPGADGHFVSILVTDPKSGDIVGGGITDGSVTSITVSQSSRFQSLPVRGGAFTLPPHSGFVMSHDVATALHTSEG